MPRFASNLGYLFTDRPLLERIGAAAACGFKAVELQFPYDVPASAVRAALERNKLTVLGINTLRGDGPDDFGLGAVPGRERDSKPMFTKPPASTPAPGGSGLNCWPARSRSSSA